MPCFSTVNLLLAHTKQASSSSEPYINKYMHVS